MRQKTPIIYDASEEFSIGVNKLLPQGKQDVIAIIGAKATVHGALAAAEELKKEKIAVRVIDLHCIKPIDTDALRKAIGPVEFIITAEDHYADGGLGEPLRSALAGIRLPIVSLAVKENPMSGQSEELRTSRGFPTKP